MAETAATISGPILAVDTCHGACSAAINDQGRALAGAWTRQDRGHAEVLPQMVRDVLAQACLTMSDIAGYCVTVGPGSFTGLRVGLALIKGFRLVHPRPVVAMTGFEAMAAALWQRGESGLAHVLLRSRGADVFHQEIKFQQDEQPPLLAMSVQRVVKKQDLELAANALIVGNDVAWAKGEEMEIDAAACAAIAAHMPTTDQPLAPLYIKAPDIRPSTKVPSWLASRMDAT